MKNIIRKILKEEIDRKNIFYGFVGLPNYWVSDFDRRHTDKYFEGKEYEDFYFDNFKDMDEMIGHPESLFGTRGLPVGHPKRTSRSFNDVHKKYGTAIVRVIFNQLKEELESIRGTPIYHFTTVDNALKILESNELRGTLPSDEYLNLDKRLAKTKHQMAISFTRDKNFKGDQSLAGQSKQPLDVILVLDRNKLKTRYKLEPFNYNSIDDDDFYKTKNKELEERVLNQKIYPVSNYLIDIIYKGNNPKIKEMLERYKP